MRVGCILQPYSQALKKFLDTRLSAVIHYTIEWTLMCSSKNNISPQRNWCWRMSDIRKKKEKELTNSKMYIYTHALLLLSPPPPQPIIVFLCSILRLTHV